MKTLIVGNWKMNCGGREGMTLAREIAEGFKDDFRKKVDMVICPPFTNMEGVQFECEEAEIAVGGQDCSTHDNGAYTGQISAKMLQDAMCTFVILGHSERRQYMSEKDEHIAAKTVQALKNELTAIVCVGETEEERDGGKAKEIVTKQLRASLPDEGCTAANVIIAYEPVWAIGTGKTASAQDVKEMHAHIRDELKNRFTDGGQFAILYGGSVKPDNAKEILGTENVNGALIGGASLKPQDFLNIAKAA